MTQMSIVTNSRAQAGGGAGAISRRAALGLLIGAPAALRFGAGDAQAAGAVPVPAPPAFRMRRPAPAWDARRLSFLRRETGERFTGVYYEGGAYLPEARAAIDWTLRDVRRDEAVQMDPRLIDLLRRVCAACGDRDIIVTSAYRSKITNDRLRPRGAAPNSLHLKGQAVDFYVQGLSPRRLSRLVTRHRMGGVGLYERRGFVHADVGAVRYWRG